MPIKHCMQAVIHYCQLLTIGAVRSSMQQAHSTSSSALAALSPTVRQLLIRFVLLEPFNHLTIHQLNDRLLVVFLKLYGAVMRFTTFQLRN